MARQVMALARGWCLFTALLCGVFAGQAEAGDLTIEELVRPLKFQQVKISPDGKKLAVVSLEEGQRVLALMTLEPLEITYVLRFRGNQEVGEFYWASAERIVTTVWERWGWMDNPVLVNFLYAVNYDGDDRETVFGYQVGYNQQATASRIKRQEMHKAHAEILNTLPGDSEHVLISTHPWGRGPGLHWETYGEVLRLNVLNGRTRKVSHLPGRGGRGFVDREGALHFANGVNADGIAEFYQFRDGEWQRIGDPERDYNAVPTGFSADGRYAYLLGRGESGRYELLRYELATGKTTSLFSHPRVDVAGVTNYPGTGEPMAVHLEDGEPGVHFFDPGHKVSRYLRGIHEAFPGYRVRIESETPNGKTVVVSVSGDNKPGDLFLVDLETHAAQQLLSAAPWLDPTQLSRSESFDFEARDGLQVQGYLTFPRGESRESLPMVVLPHGGPSARDYWEFDRVVQLLANAGYLVMQVNFRGSTGYGDTFAAAADGNWGATVQDDIADATRWVVDRGYADRERICIYGASFGAYSALMNVVRERELYQCAAGFAGIYDLALLHESGDISRRRSGKAYLQEAIGTDTERLEQFSPVHKAAEIQVPVFIAHGGEDQRAPVEHAEALEEALEDAGVDVTTQYFDEGGHGYYSPAANHKLYEALLGFLDEHIGG